MSQYQVISIRKRVPTHLEQQVTGTLTAIGKREARKLETLDYVAETAETLDMSRAEKTTKAEPKPFRQLTSQTAGRAVRH